jgi:hypothetical protein
MNASARAITLWNASSLFLALVTLKSDGACCGAADCPTCPADL